MYFLSLGSGKEILNPERVSETQEVEKFECDRDREVGVRETER